MVITVVSSSAVIRCRQEQGIDHRTGSYNGCQQVGSGEAASCFGDDSGQCRANGLTNSEEDRNSGKGSGSPVKSKIIPYGSSHDGRNSEDRQAVECNGKHQPCAASFKPDQQVGSCLDSKDQRQTLLAAYPVGERTKQQPGEKTEKPGP